MPTPVWTYRTALASYLRRYPYEWRLRRRDYLAPVDFHLAKRQISLQGLLREDLYTAFRAETGVDDVLRLEDGRSGQIFLPFAFFPKRVLLDFTTQDSGSQQVPLLTREEDCRVSATHLLSLWPAKSYPDSRSVEARGAHLVLRVLCSVDPAVLGRRIRNWRLETTERSRTAKVGEFAKHLKPSRSRAAQPGRIFRDEGELESWVEYELEQFSSGLLRRAGELPSILRETVTSGESLDLREYLPFDADANLNLLLPFASLDELVVAGVREAARLLARDALRPTGTVETPRNVQLAAELQELLPAGLAAVSQMLEQIPIGVPRMAARKELARAAIGWMAHLVIPVTLDQPFQYRTSELIPFDRESFMKRQTLRLFTYQTYSVSPTDAQSNHVEIATEDLELSLDCSGDVVKAGTSTYPAREFFGEEYSESHAVAHFYNGALPTESPFRRHDTIAIYARYKLPLAIKAGYLMTVSAVAGVASWGAYERVHRGASAEDNVLIVAAAFAVVLVFLMNVQHRPIVHGKLEFARLAFYVSAAGLLVVPVVEWLISS